MNKKILFLLLLSTSLVKREIPQIGIRKNMGGYEIGLNVFDLLDTDYQRPHGFSQQGRNVGITLRRAF